MFGQSISVIGSWMQQAATVWLLYQLTKSSTLLGLSDFISLMPAAVLLFFLGVLTDRWNRQRTVIATQSLAMLHAFALMTLTMCGVINVWQIFALGAFAGLVGSFDATARQALMVEMVDRSDDLANAIAINASVFNAARLVGPAIAGVVLSIGGAWPCFMLNGISFVPVIASLFMMRVRPAVVTTHQQGIWEGFNEGIEYIAGSLPIRTLLVLVALLSAMATPLTVLMPILAQDVLHGGPHTYGLLLGSLGIGALGASLFLASQKSVLGLGKVIAISTGGFGICLGLLACSQTFWLSALILVFTGFSMIAQMAAVNMVLQTIVEEGKRGRVMSFYTMAFVGIAPIGSLATGYMASRLGVAATLIACGAACIASSLVFTAMLPSMRIAMREIYLRVGVLDEPSPEHLPATVGLVVQEPITSAA